jgi:hypothetical protein
MNKLEQVVLIGIANEVAHWQQSTVASHDRSLSDVRRWRREMRSKELAADAGCLIDLAAFLGMEPTDSERTMATRAYKRLEAAGYIERVASLWSDRSRAVKLLPAGQAKVQELTGSHVDTFLPVAVYVTDHAAGTENEQPSENLNPGTPGEVLDA